MRVLRVMGLLGLGLGLGLVGDVSLDSGYCGSSCHTLIGAITSILEVDSEVGSGVFAGASGELKLDELVSDSELAILMCAPICAMSGSSESSRSSLTISLSMSCSASIVLVKVQ